MKVEIYIFGSVLSGNVDPGSDVDILAIVPAISEKNKFPQCWTVYTSDYIKEMFQKGRLFAWHLYKESMLIFPKGETGLLHEYGPPNSYNTAAYEISSLITVANGAVKAIQEGKQSKIFDYGLIYLTSRDIAMAASLFINGEFNFSRQAPFHLKAIAFPFSREEYDFLTACRRASVRGHEVQWNAESAAKIKTKLNIFLEWCNGINNLITDECFYRKIAS